MRKRLTWLTLLALLTFGPVVATASAHAQGDGSDVLATETTGQEPAPVEDDLSTYRILSYYGFPGNEYMGILGEYSMPDLLGRLREQAAGYEEADPSRPVKLAFEVIASVAQRDPQDNGSYLTYTDPDLIQQYVDFTAENDLMLILDVQFGRTTVQQEIDQVRDWLKYPHVQLALDAEFAVKDGETPGVDLGSLDASDVLYAQQEMVKIAQEANIPPKILILHQFNIYTVTNKEDIQPMNGVQFVLEVDGFGTPDEKRETYSVMTKNPIQYHGFKLWYSGEDDPLMTPEEVLALDPSPDIIIYQ